MAELHKVSIDWPLCFMELPNKTFSLFAMQSFIPEQNLFVDDKGKWLHQYVPAWNRVLPFWFIMEKNIIAFQDELDCVTKNPNEQDEFYPLFDKENNMSKELVEHIQFIKQLTDNTNETEKIIAELNDLNLITKWPIKLKFEKEEKTIDGIHIIDREKLKKITSNKVTKLFKCKALELAYLQLLSTENLNKLQSRHIMRNKNQFVVDDNRNLREKAIDQKKKDETKELDELVENLLSE